MNRFAFLVAVAGLCIAGPARADTITTFDAGGSFVDGATFTGTLTIDVTTGTVQTVDIAVTSPDSLVFSFIQYQASNYPTTGDDGIQTGTTASGLPNFNICVATPTLVGYQGGAIGSLIQRANGVVSDIYYSSSDQNGVLQGSITPTPEPASLTLMSVGSVALLGYGWRRRKRASE